MVTSQNGYIANDRSQIVTMNVEDANIKIPVRRGPVAQLLMYVAWRFHHEVEALVPGTCWGYAERTIRGSSTVLSNHASGTAIDLNAPQHPLGTDPTSNYTFDQISAIHQIVRDTRDVVRWGGDYTGRKDGMHFEIDANENAVAALIQDLDKDPGRTNGVTSGDAARQLTDFNAAWAGGFTDDAGTKYRMLQFIMRNNVEVHQTYLIVQGLRDELKELKELVSEVINRNGPTQ